MAEAITTTPTEIAANAPTAHAKPSALYRGGLWKFALTTARAFPRPLARGLAIAASQTYRIASPRSRIIFENLLPALNEDEIAATAATRRLFSNFATKMVDLLRFEAGVDSPFREMSGWDIFHNAYKKGTGMLFVTPHLGNWEIGAPLVTNLGIKFYAVTQAEPGSNFTEMRRQARARWGIDTIVVGEDPFSFIEIIRRLNEGAIVALLIDRPAAQSSTTVKLFGRDFQASLAPAELARASGCAVLGGVIVEERGQYLARFLPEFEYNRRALGNREGRIHFTQQIIDAFAPSIREYADQWYNFVPIWPK
jgi:KDO2-lipid IV(A) lauroyltransferase